MKKKRWPTIEAGCSSKQLMWLQNEELQKDPAHIDVEFLKNSSDAILERDRQTMDWAPTKDEAFQQLMEKACPPSKSHVNKKIMLFSLRRLVIAACVACFLLVSAYADIHGRVLKNLDYATLVFTAKDAQQSARPSDLQTNNPLYKQLEAMQITEAMLPLPEALSGYAVSVQQGALSDSSKQMAVISWSSGKQYFRYEIEQFDVSTSFTSTRNYFYERTETFSENGLEFLMAQYRGETSIAFYAGNILYTIHTNLDWDTARSIAVAVR